MSYVQTILQPHEKILAEGRLHWIIYVQPLLIFLIAIFFFFLGSVMRHNDVLVLIWVIATAFLFLFSVVTAISTWFNQWITEIAVTNLRVIYKTGFILRRTREMNMDKVESVTVDQSILGRVLDYGTIHIRGTGEGIEHLHRVASPIQLRNAIVAR